MYKIEFSDAITPNTNPVLYMQFNITYNLIDPRSKIHGINYTIDIRSKVHAQRT